MIHHFYEFLAVGTGHARSAQPQRRARRERRRTTRSPTHRARAAHGREGRRLGRRGPRRKRRVRALAMHGARMRCCAVRVGKPQCRPLRAQRVLVSAASAWRGRTRPRRDELDERFDGGGPAHDASDVYDLSREARGVDGGYRR